MEAMYRARKGEYVLYEMRHRSRMQQMAKVYTVDMREELKNGNHTILSGKLQSLMEERLERGEQIILFLNRRGYSGFVSCRECGHVIQCPHCNVSLSVHKGGKMVCHYCGYEQPKIRVCPECGSRELLGYPPAEELMAVLAAGEDERLLETGCKYLKEYVLRIKGKAPLEVIGPASPGVDKIKDIYRRVIYIKAPEYRTLIRVKDLMEQYIEINSGFAKLRIQFDFNPMNL